LDLTFFPQENFKLLRNTVNLISRIASFGEFVEIEAGA